MQRRIIRINFCYFGRIFNFALEYAIRKVQQTNLGQDMNGTHQILAYADDVNLIGDDIRTMERNSDV